MTKRKNSQPSQFAIFPVSAYNHPIENLLSVGGNIIVRAGAEWLNREFRDAIGLPGTSIKSQIELTRAKLLLAKQEADTTRAKILGEKQLMLLDQKIRQMELVIEQKTLRLESAQAASKQLALPTMAVVSGALEMQPDSQGLAGAPDQLEAYEAWLGSFREGKILSCMGKRGSGKSSLLGKLAEYLNARYHMPVCWVGLPGEARPLLPRWIQMADSVERCPPGSFIICDESGIVYLSLAYNSDKNKFLRRQLMICRHRGSSMAFAVQSSRDMDNSIVRLADCFMFKEPSLHQHLSERSDMRSMAKHAALVFDQIPKNERLGAAYVFDSEFEGLIKSAVPSFWSEPLSHIYSNLDLGKIEEDGIKRRELQKVAADEVKLLDEVSLDKQILERRRQGTGINKIATDLGCTAWRVRKCLDSLRDSN